MHNRKILTTALSLFSGLLFGAGLIISDMANPHTVQNFLDLAGTWDMRLIFVMMGALLVASIGFAISKSRRTSLLGETFPAIRQGINPRLVWGAVIFGIGWGIAGICPAPALVLIGVGAWQAVLFFVSMLIAMAITMHLEHRF